MRLTAAQLAAALPGATFTHGWVFDAASGSVAPAFGGVTLVASGAGIVYGDPGPAGGFTRSMGFTASSTGKLDAGVLFDIGANTDELIVAWGGRWNALPSAFGQMFGRASSAFGNGWSINGNDGAGLSFGLGPGSTWGTGILGSAAYMVGRPHVGLAVISRSGTDFAQLGVRDLFGSTTLLSAQSTSIDGSAASTGEDFTVGSGVWVPGNDNFRLSFLAIGKGPGVTGAAAADLGASLASLSDVIAQGPAARLYAGMLRALLPPGRVWG